MINVLILVYSDEVIIPTMCNISYVYVFALHGFLYVLYVVIISGHLFTHIISCLSLHHLIWNSGV